jgi:hypothetical protein
MQTIVNKTPRRMRPYFLHKFGLSWMPLYAFLACFLMTQGALGGLVLCVGADGHLKVETAHARGPDNHPAKGHRGPCLDIPLAGSWVAADNSPLPADANLLSRVRESTAFILFIPPVCLTNNAPQHVLPCPEHMSSLPSAFSRSPILLI